jgi:hypothetical protein
MKRNPYITAVFAASLALATPAWAGPLPVSDPGGPYAVISAGSLSLSGSGTPSDTGTSITTYEWDLDGNDDFLDATGATPAAITYATLTTTWGMTSGPNTIKLRVTDDSGTPLTAIAEATVWINGTIYDGANGAWNNDSWNDVGPTPWDGGASPAPSGAGPFEVVIAAGKHPTVLVATPAYTGNLTVEAGAIMEIGQTNVASTLNALGTGTITFKSGSDLTLRYTVNSTHPQDFILDGNMIFALGRSTSAHHEQRTLTGSISGPGVMTVHDTNNQRLFLQGDSSLWTGGMVTGGSESESKNATIEADATNSLGSGPITIGDGNTLRIDGANATTGTPGTTVLTLNGNKSNNEAFKLYMNADDTVDQCFYQGVQLPAGSYTGGDFPWLSGSGTLTVATGSTETTPPTVVSWADNVTSPIYEDQVEVTYTVTFDEDISTTLTTSEFAVVGTGGASGTVSSVTKTSVALNPAVYTVVVQPSGTGTIQLQIPGTASIEDLNGNALVVPASDPTVITINSGSTPITPGNRYWDGTIASGTTNGASDGGTANWDNGTTTNWDRGPGLSAPVAWNNAGSDTAVFGGTAGTVTLDNNITLDGLTVNLPSNTGSGYSIGNVGEDNTLTFSGAKTVTTTATGTGTNQDVTITAGIAGSPTMNIAGRATNSVNQFNLLPGSGVTQTIGTLNMLNTFASDKRLILGGESTGNVADAVTWATTGNQLHLTKAGTGSWTINNDVLGIGKSGRLYVEQGTLTLGGTGNFFSHKVGVSTVRSSTFTASGTASKLIAKGTITIGDNREWFYVQNMGTLSPGPGVETLNVTWNANNNSGATNGAFNMQTGSTYEWDIASAASTDVINVTTGGSNVGNLILGNMTIKVTDAGVATPIAALDQLTVFTYETGAQTVARSIGTVTIDVSGLGAGWGGTPSLVDNGAGTIYITGLTFTPGGGSPYDTWATGGELFGDDANGDGVSNGLAFLLGAANPDANALGLLPTPTEDGSGGLVMTFSMLDSASRGTAALSVEHSGDLGITDAWVASLVPDSTSSVSGVGYVVSGSGTLSVVATIPVGNAIAGKLFGRLKAEKP